MKDHKVEVSPMALLKEEQVNKLFPVKGVIKHFYAYKTPTVVEVRISKTMASIPIQEE